MKLDRLDAAARRPASGPAAPDDDLLSLRELLARLWAGRWIVLATLTLVVGLAALGVARLPASYLATATVMFNAQKPRVVEITEMLVEPAFSQDTLQNEVQVLRSTSLLARVIAQLRLERSPVFNPALRPPPDTLWTRIGAAVLPPATVPAETAAAAERRTRQLVVEELRRRLVVTPIEGTRVIAISFAAPHPEAAATIANTVASQYIVDQLVAKTETMRSAIDWLTGRVAEARQQLRDADNGVAALRAALAGEAGQGLGVTEQQLVALNGALSTARSRAAELAARHQRLREGLAEGADPAAVAGLRDSALITGWRVEEDRLAERLAALSPNHPAAAQLRTELAGLDARIRAEAGNIVAAVGAELDTARAQEASLAAEVHEIETKALGQSREHLRLRQLERDADASRLLYETMLKRLKETSEEVELQAAAARILSPAEPPLRPESARRHLILAMAAAFGTLLGVGLVFLRDQLDDSVRSPRQIEELTGIPVLATIPAIGRRDRRDVVRLLRERPSSSLAESARNLRTSLLYANGAHPPTVVLFTSSVPREGKSTTALLTALTGRQMGKSAIIVDCDLRKPAPGGADLAAVLDGTLPLESAIQVDPATGLHRLATRHGAADASPADTLASPGFAALVRRLAEHYELVVLDAPPALVVTDARVLSAISDAVVYAVRWGRTPGGAVAEGLRELRSVDAPIAGIALTMIDEARAAKTTVDGYTYYKGRFRDYYRD